MTTAQPSPLAQLLGAKHHPRLTALAKQWDLTPASLARLLIVNGLGRLESGEVTIRSGDAMALGVTARPQVQKPALTLRKKHADTIVRAARILHVRPQDFLDWHLNDTVESLNDLDGELWQWVMDDMIVWPSPEDAVAARERYAAWLKSKGATPAFIKRQTTPPAELGRKPPRAPDAAA